MRKFMLSLLLAFGSLGLSSNAILQASSDEGESEADSGSGYEEHSSAEFIY